MILSMFSLGDVDADSYHNLPISTQFLALCPFELVNVILSSGGYESGGAHYLSSPLKTRHGEDETEPVPVLEPRPRYRRTEESPLEGDSSPGMVNIGSMFLGFKESHIF